MVPPGNKATRLSLVNHTAKTIHHSSLSFFQKQKHEKSMQKVLMVKLNEYIFLIDDDDLLDKYNTIWDKLSAEIKKRI